MNAIPGFTLSDTRSFVPHFSSIFTAFVQQQLQTMLATGQAPRIFDSLPEFLNQISLR